MGMNNIVCLQVARQRPCSTSYVFPVRDVAGHMKHIELDTKRFQRARLRVNEAPVPGAPIIRPHVGDVEDTHCSALPGQSSRYACYLTSATPSTTRRCGDRKSVL